VKFEISPGVWQFGGLSLLSLVVLWSLRTDLSSRRIPNKLVVFALCAGVLTHLVGPAGNGLLSNAPGNLGVQAAMLGALTGLLLFLPLYTLRAMGAGDVKLTAAIGAFTGPADMVNVALFILLMGGALALVRMLWAGSSRRVLLNLQLMLLPVFAGGQRRFDPATQSADRMPFAVAIAAGLLAYGAWLWLWGSPPLRF